MKYGFKEIIEMSKQGVHDSIIDAIIQFHWEVNVEDVLEAQKHLSDALIIRQLEAMNVPANANRGNNSGGENIPTGGGAISTDIKDYEPSKKDGFYQWKGNGGYVNRRMAYCYAVASKGVTKKFLKGVTDMEEGSSFKNAYDKAKEVYNNTYKYVKKADRK